MNRPKVSSGFLSVLRPWLFSLICASLYGVAFVFDPERTNLALHACARIFRQLGLPLCVALGMMVLLNRFLSPSLAARLLGRKAGLGGALLSGAAGVLSMGPIYAWYPLFTALRDKGASSFNIANFMCCRSIKPVLVPVLIGYFGWRLTGLFLAMNLAGAVLAAASVAVFCPFDDGNRSGEPTGVRETKSGERD